MATPSEKLASSLEALRIIQEKGKTAIKSRDLSRIHRERLLRNGFIQEVMKGWYITASPDQNIGESTPWYASFWGFCSEYLNDRFGDNWCVSPEQSLLLHSGNQRVPNQLIIRSPQAGNKSINLLHNISLLDIRALMPSRQHHQQKDGIYLFSPESALIHCSPNFFVENAIDVRAVLSMLSDVSGLLSLLLENGHSIIAGKLAGALRNIGRTRHADDIIDAMRKAGYDIREIDPFEDKPLFTFGKRDITPHVNRIKLMWETMREPVLANFPKASHNRINPIEYMKYVEQNYVNDAYHSLSIEGYQVTQELIERVRQGDWNPDTILEDKEQHNALAARGYWQAFQAVQRTIERIIIKKENAGLAIEEDHGTWYRELFVPSVNAGLLKPSDLAGYRSNPVFIRKSMHIPPNYQIIRDLMPAFFELMEAEIEPSVRVVLGHFLFVYIHPYSDGNGRIGRFIMNVMFASGGYPWTIIPLEKRQNYMDALEQASVHQDIVPFTKFLGSLIASDK